MASTYVDTNRTVYYYNLEFKYYVDYEPKSAFGYMDIFKHISDVNKARDESRIIKHRNGRLFSSGFRYYASDKRLTGKLFYVREDVFPEIIKLSNEEIRDFQLDIDEGMLETTHFVLDYSKSIPLLAIEYNHHGARITDLEYYLKKFGRSERIATNCDVTMIVQDRLKDISRRINRLQKLQVRVHRDNIARIKSASSELGSALFHAQNFSLSDEVELILRFDYRNKTSTTVIKDIVKDMISKFKSDKNAMNDFNKFEIKAEDEDRNNKLEVFDLLVDKVRSDIVTKKKIKSRVIYSKDFYEKTCKSMNELFELNWTDV